MNLGQLKTEFLSLADDPSISDTQAGTWINVNYKTLLREYPWSFLNATGSYTVTSGTQERAFSAFTTAVTDFAKALKAWTAPNATADKSELTPIFWEDRNQAGIKNSYYITPDNLSIGLVPKPTNSTDIITLDYSKIATDLSANTDTPIFVSDFHWILVFKALMNYQFQQREDSEDFKQQYVLLFRLMVDFYKMPALTATPRLQRGYRQVGRDSSSPLVP